MDSTEPSLSHLIQYPSRTMVRAARAIRCGPFRGQLLADMGSQSVPISAIAENRGVHNGYTNRPLSELATENELLWLIEVGLLRREVDGQGITDRFCLTPLGRQLISQWKSQACPDPTPALKDHIYNAVNRWLRLPSWL